MSKGNELTTELIVAANKAKSHPIDGFLNGSVDTISSDIPILNSPHQA